MAFHLTQHVSDGVTVLVLEGRLLIGPAVEEFRTTLDTLLAGAHTRVTLDCQQLDYIDSSALGALVVAHTKFEKAGGTLTLFGLNRRSVELLVVTKLATVFHVAGSEREAIDLCYPERQTKHFDILSFVEKLRAEREAARDATRPGLRQP